jgi:hypothetical protein
VCRIILTYETAAARSVVAQEARFSRAFRNSPGTGIDGLDEVTGGGLPKGRISVLLTAAPFGSDSN